MTITYDEQGNAIGQVQLTGSSVIDTAILEANPNTTAYALPTTSDRITVLNTSRYVAAYITVNTKKIRIEPGQTVKIFGENITSLDYSSAVGKAILQIIMGDIDVATTNVPPVSSAYMEKHSHQILCCRGNEVYRVKAPYQISYSSDNGVVFASKKDMSPVLPSDGFITNAKTLIFRGNDGNLYRSIDKGSTTTQVKTGVRGWRSGGIAQFGNTIIYVEYGTDEGTYNIWRSTDDGATWTSVYARTAPTDIRHFHSVDYDIFGGKWYATSGDGDSQCVWYESANDGATWSAVVGASGSQKWRTTNLIFPGDGTVIWASDSDTKYRGVYRAELSNLAGATKIFHLDAPALTTFNIGPNIAVCTRVEGAVVGESIPSIYVTRDNGNIWQKELEWPLKTSSFSGTVVDGFSDSWGPDCDGGFYVYVGSNLIGRGGTDNIMGMKFRF